MGIIIGVVNEKGGVGKTTTAVNIAAGLGLSNKKVLLIDFDPQGNSTTGLGIKKNGLEYTSYDVVLGKCRPQNAVIPTRFKNVSIIPADHKLSNAEPTLTTMEGKNMQLRKAVLQIKDSYDIIIIDSLPSLGILAINVLIACDTIIVPMVCEHFAREGLAQLVSTVNKVKQKLNRSLYIMGIVFTMVNKRQVAEKEIKTDLINVFEKQKAVFKTEIPRNVKISEAQSHGEPVIYYDKKCPASEAYIKLSKEISAKIKEMEKLNAQKN